MVWGIVACAPELTGDELAAAAVIDMVTDSTPELSYLDDARTPATELIWRLATTGAMTESEKYEKRLLQAADWVVKALTRNDTKVTLLDKLPIVSHRTAARSLFDYI